MDSGQQNRSQIPRMIWVVGTPIIFTIGIIGNVITILVLTHKNQSKSSTTVYLTVLAVADMLVMTISLPRWWLIYMFGIDVRHLSNGMCKLHWFLTYFDSGVSVSILVAVTIERVLSIMKPHRMKKLCTVRSAVAVSVGIILTLVVIFAHVLYGLNLFYKEVPRETGTENINDAQFLTANTNCSTTDTADCSSLNLGNDDEFGSNTSTRLIRMCWFSEPNYGNFYRWPFQIMNIFLYNIIPEVVFFIGGVIIVRMLTVKRKRVAPTIQNRNQPNTDIHSKQITVSLLLINTVFFICTTPLFVFLLGQSVWIDAEKGMTETQEIIWAVVNMMFYINHAANFVLYFLSGSRFRKEVLVMLRCRKPTRDNSSVISHRQAHSTL